MANISIDVRKKTIQELINEEIPSGKYWLPSFQRHYVWDSDNIKELLDSIVQNWRNHFMETISRSSFRY